MEKNFLLWLSQRLIFKHEYQPDSFVVQKLIKLAKSQDIDINDQDLDMIIGKYYVDFFLDKAGEMNIGYTTQERETIRNNVRSMTVDIINKNISLNIIK